MAMTRVLGLRRAPRLRALQPVGPAMMAGTATLTRDVAVMEEELRVKLWKAKFSLADGEVAALRASFEFDPPVPADGGGEPVYLDVADGCACVLLGGSGGAAAG